MEAVPDLINALTAGRNKWVEMPVDRYFLEWVTVFTADTVVHLSAGLSTASAPQIGVG